MPGPTGFGGTTALICGVEVTSFAIDTDYSGPYLLLDVTLGTVPQAVEFEVERYLTDGSTEPVVTVTSTDGHARVDALFNTRYRVRARLGSCDTEWRDVQIGPPNPCGDCGGGDEPPTPPPPPPPDDDDDHDGDDGCDEGDGDRHKNDRGEGHDRDRKPGQGRGHDPCRAKLTS